MKTFRMTSTSWNDDRSQYNAHTKFNEINANIPAMKTKEQPRSYLISVPRFTNHLSPACCFAVTDAGRRAPGAAGRIVALRGIL